MSVLHFSTPSLLYGLWHEATAFIMSLDGGNVMEVAMWWNSVDCNNNYEICVNIQFITTRTEEMADIVYPALKQVSTVHLNGSHLPCHSLSALPS